eukprot:COSAG04_NODE_483_length_13588_cov_21.765068_15_plen_207_part_01
MRDGVLAAATTSSIPTSTSISHQLLPATALHFHPQRSAATTAAAPRLSAELFLSQAASFVAAVLRSEPGAELFLASELFLAAEFCLAALLRSEPQRMATQTTATTTQTTTPEIHSYGSSFGRSWRQKLEARMARTPEQTAALRELGLNTVAAGIAGGIQPALFNPLDCLRVRIQVASAPSATSTLRTGLVFAQRQGYWAALHGPGLR